MRFELLLPDVGEGIGEGAVVEWHVAAGETVREDQPIVDMETDKAIVTIPSPVDGVVTELAASVGDTVAVGSMLAVFDATNRTQAPGAPVSDVASRAPEPPALQPAAAPPSDGGAPARSQAVRSEPAIARRPLASPDVRGRARALGIDLTTVVGTGPGGRILREDLLAAAEPAAATEPRRGPGSSGRVGSGGSDERVKLSGLRLRIAKTMEKSWREIPHIIDYREVDATALVQLRAAIKASLVASDDPALAGAMTFMPFLVKIAAVALSHNRAMNASIDMASEEIINRGAINIGVAAATPEGLIVPVVRDADQKSIDEIAIELQTLVAAARVRTLTVEQVTGATFTVNNYGAFGAWLGTPLIKPPEVGNLGLGRIEKRAVVVDDAVVPRWTLPVSASADHRIVDGDGLGRFVSEFAALVKEPSLLLRDLR